MTKTILITGSSSGLGRATAKHFHAKGWNVVATMRNPEREEELIRLDRVLVTRLDVQDLASIQAAVDAGISKFGRIDALMNNAGYGAYGPLEVTSLDKIRRQLDVNVLGVLATTKALLPHFRANRSGVIVNISSGGGRVTLPLGTLYHGTKFAVEGLSESPGSASSGQSRQNNRSRASGRRKQERGDSPRTSLNRPRLRREAGAPARRAKLLTWALMPRAGRRCARGPAGAASADHLDRGGAGSSAGSARVLLHVRAASSGSER
ncbi:SDR family NAD(P)-dependent oxidoreductase [Sorangium sp. So ce260]|uniref:SDR family NAD(P)-dependent oxidoreductase n=1 Tax=Sorangium sp. So ce260 TaxID=3133291 RepID=UPI003F60F9EC